MNVDILRETVCRQRPSETTGLKLQKVDTALEMPSPEIFHISGLITEASTTTRLTYCKNRNFFQSILA